MYKSIKGFTVVELLVSLAIMSVAMTSIYGLYMSYVRVYTTEGVTTKVQQSVRAGMNMMVRDIRMVGLDPHKADIFGIEEITSHSIRFTADRDMDGVLDDPDLSAGSIESNLEHIAFEWDGNDLLEMVLYHPDDTEVARDTLMDNVTNLNFTYLDAADAATAVPADIRTVVVQLTVQKPAGRGDPVIRTHTKRIRCRNLDF
jgi:prepilin-type N-terminal cleavage/methylation domain-containing protein